jgi:peptide/nickel transport system permease protein
MRTVDVFLAFPSLILALAFVAALGPGIENAIIAISLAAWPPIARLARAETLSIRSRTTSRRCSCRRRRASGSSSAT